MPPSGSHWKVGKARGRSWWLCSLVFQGMGSQLPLLSTDWEGLEAELGIQVSWYPC